ncbi:hypothetical protein DFH08DRAFT_969735 [Mycena albidolilacea]|uniref:Zn(2)-C6 fungal-type domain-containing protein n=1 Tax=Mycena albidolilacea TaxID=1033008 RepID=A0AAD6ZGY1_9AGAR|nr:hypothetical protein DFH08DRAFT_969735 [Mycena albidolilacea]
MPQLPNESKAEYLDRLCAMSEDAAEEELDEAEADIRKQERKRRKEEKKEAKRRAKEAEEEAARKAREEEAARKAKEEEKKRKKAEKAERAAKAAAKPASKTSVASGSSGIGSQASGSGGKAKGKAKATRKASDIDEDEDEGEETPAEKKAKRDPCQQCARLQVPCADPDPTHGRIKACEGCRNAKVRCIRDSSEADGNRVSEAIQELTELVEGIAEDNYISQREIKGSLQDLIQFEATRLRLEFGDDGKAEANRLLALRKSRRADWKTADAARAKGEGSSKEK